MSLYSKAQKKVEELVQELLSMGLTKASLYYEIFGEDGEIIYYQNMHMMFRIYVENREWLADFRCRFTFCDELGIEISHDFDASMKKIAEKYGRIKNHVTIE